MTPRKGVETLKERYGRVKSGREGRPFQSTRGDYMETLLMYDHSGWSYEKAYAFTDKLDPGCCCSSDGCRLCAGRRGLWGCTNQLSRSTHLGVPS